MSAEKVPHEVEEQDDDSDLGGTGNAVDYEDGEETFAEDVEGGTATDRAFDETVGALEDMLLDAEFLAFQRQFFQAHCGEFAGASAGSENKLSYMNLFEQYQERMEGFISGFLSRRLGDSFDMEAFLGECEARGEEQLAGDAFDVLTSMSDFESFKELMIAEYSQQKEGQQAQWTAVGNSAAAAGAGKASSAAAASSK